MEKKTLYIGGGIAAVLLVGVIVIKKAKSNTQQTSQQSTPVYADMGYLSSLAPTSGGYSSSDSSTVAATTANSGSGFDIGSLLSTLITSQSKSNSESTQANSGNTDSAILSAIVGSNGSATVSHSASGTTITNTPSGDLYDQALTGLYKQEFNRAPDAGGLAYWKSAMMNQGLSIVDVQKQMEQSDEYKKSHPA